MINRIKCCLVGFSDQKGVEHVGGRLGAAGGPTAFRQCFDRLSGRVPLKSMIDDLGDVSARTARLEDTLEAAADKVREAHARASMSVVVGGGHDFGFAQLLGLRRALGAQARIGCINLDAHLDVRAPAPLITSGSPFYLALEQRVIEPNAFIEFGIQSQCNGPALWSYIAQKGVKVVTLEESRAGAGPIVAFQQTLDRLVSQCDAVVISLDLDCLAEGYAPGVSAPQADGYRPDEIFAMLTAASAEPKVRSLGIFELNPVHDRDQQTARLAATAAYRFLAPRLAPGASP